MQVICVRGGSGEAVLGELLLLAPRVGMTAAGATWLDGRGLSAAAVGAVATTALELLGGRGAGVARTPVAAWVAAGLAASAGVGEQRVHVVEGSDRSFLAVLPIEVLGLEERLAVLLEGVGVETCGALAALPREAVEVRFGPAALEPWRWVRGEDPRRVFSAPPRTRPHASLDFVDYVVTDPERLLFTTNALLGSVCEVLVERGEHARALELHFALADGGSWRRLLRAGRPTASRTAWLRLVRSELERLTVPDAVMAVSLEVAATEVAGVAQGDLFDRGFATASAVEAALLRLVERGQDVLVTPETGAHPLIERRSSFKPVAPTAPATLTAPTVPATLTAPTVPAAAGSARERSPVEIGLTLQLLPAPRRVRVETARRRDHHIPLRYHDRLWRRLATVAGPDRLSGGRWEAAYAREYFRAVTEEGVLVWLFRDARDDLWYLHGWWD